MCKIFMKTTTNNKYLYDETDDIPNDLNDFQIISILLIF
jgi:hypothetical protein